MSRPFAPLLRLHQHHAKVTEATLPGLDHEAPSGQKKTEQRVDAEETWCLIELAIARLPEMYRDVFVLSVIKGLCDAEIGESMGLSLAAVKSRLHSARILFRDALAPHFQEWNHG
jgi:DNA-directed RNA polymerase specialized sigma24 family protein